MHDGMIVATGDRTLRPLRMPPVRAGAIFPPGEIVAQADRAIRFHKHQRTRHQQRRIGIGIHRRIRRTLGIGDVSRSLDEFSEFGVGDGVDVDPEAIDEGRTDRAFLSIEAVGAHQEVAARDPVHGFGVDRVGHQARFGLAGESAAALSPAMAGCTMRDRFRSRRCSHRIQTLACCLGTKSSAAPGGISSSFLALSSKSLMMRWACCITHQRT